VTNRQGRIVDGINRAPCPVFLPPAAFSHVSGLHVQDIFDFPDVWSAGSPQAGIGDGGLAVQDISSFLNV
jgi:hypothetical protein